MFYKEDIQCINVWVVVSSTEKFYMTVFIIDFVAKEWYSLGRGNKKNVKTKRAVAHRLSKTFEMPENLFSGSAQIEVLGNKEAVVDGCRGVIEYDDEIIRLNAGNMVICFHGVDPEIKGLTPSNAVISGTITSIEFS